MIANRRTASALCVLLTMSACMSTSAAQPPTEQKEDAPKKLQLPITISKETTRITEPLRKDGYVNYIAALNQMAGEGVTPENNSAVLFWQAVGPGEIKEEHREEFFKLLGIEPLAEDGDYFVEIDEYFEDEDVFEDYYEEAMERPWTKKEFPKIAKWLKANEKPLGILLEASRRPRHFEPLLQEQDMLLDTLLPSIQKTRAVARVLCARAMLHLGEGKVDEAWADLLALQRLARLSGQRVILIDTLVANAIEGLAMRNYEMILQHASLTTVQVTKMRADLQKLPPMPKMAEIFNVGERYMFLDSVAALARKGIGSIKKLTLEDDDPALDKLIDKARKTTIDWDLVLRMGNSWYDRVEGALSKPTPDQNKLAMEQLENDLQKIATEAKNHESLASAYIKNPRKAVSERIGMTLVGLSFGPTTWAPQIITTVGELEDRQTMRFQVTELAFALAAYRADHGSYPAELAALVPKYVDKIPDDIFSDKPLEYKRKGDGYLLYSVGRNGIDDNGRGREDRGDTDEWDDITVEVK